MKYNKPKDYPICDGCDDKAATCFVYLDEEWAVFCDDCQVIDNPYWVGFDSFFESSKEQNDWIDHLSKKISFPGFLDAVRYVSKWRG
jgi:hypothetical protein